MTGLNSEWEDRINHWIRTLKDDFYEPLGRIELEAYRTREHLSHTKVKQLAFTPVEPGFTWGNTWEYCWFRGEFILPEAAMRKRIVLNLQPGGETSLFINGREFGTYRADWIAYPHHYMVDNTVTANGQPGERYHIYMETYAGHYFPNCETGYCATGPVMPGSFTEQIPEGSRRTLGNCTYGSWREEAYQLFLDVDTLYRLLKILDASSLRAVKIISALQKFTYEVDFEQDGDSRLICYAAARNSLKEVLEAVNGSTAPWFWAVGNAHLDLAWLWPVAETRRKTERTFAAQLRLLEEYPEYRFLQSQPAAYEMCRNNYPKLFGRIKDAISRGQWIADGAMWVEPDTNMAGGEALIRQLIHGKRYYKEVLGVDSRVLWLPDTFGYTAALPQILMGCDVPYLVTQKIFWTCNDGERFPYHYFHWEGMDGTRVTSFLPTSYTYQTDPEEVGNVWKQRTQKEDLETFLLPFGYGDGGGGPSRDHIEYVLRQRDLEGSPRMRMGSPEEFFMKLEEQGGPQHTYAGELYFTSHRGTYTSQAGVKRNNRRCELAMREMELWSCLAMAKGMEYDAKRSDRLWKLLLFHQFHDILPGSSIERVYQETERDHESILKEAGQMTQQAADALVQEGEGLAIFNSLSFSRQFLLPLPEQYRDGAVDGEGHQVPVQEIDGSVRALVELPSCGGITLYPRKAISGEAAEAALEEFSEPVPIGMISEKTAAEEVPGRTARLWQDEQGYHMKNKHISALIDKQGRVISFVLKSSGRQMAAGPMNQLRLFKDVPRHFDAWDIDDNYRNQEVEGAREQELTIISQGLEAVLKVSGKISRSDYVQYIRLAANQKRLEFETCIEWRELHRLLKAAFPVSVHAINARNEMQFGYVERPTHRSRTYDKDRFEVCNHRYTALCDGAHGAAVLNDSKYGISMEGNAMELTLLRAASSPQMRADNGVQKFTYAFYAWEGSFIDSDVVRQGYELNVAPYVTRGRVQTFEALQIDKKNVILETMKPAEDGSGDIILRFYEAAGAAVTSRITINWKAERAWLCDMLEHPREELGIPERGLRLPFGTFEIKTIRLQLSAFPYN